MNHMMCEIFIVCKIKYLTSLLHLLSRILCRKQRFAGSGSSLHDQMIIHSKRIHQLRLFCRQPHQMLLHLFQPVIERWNKTEIRPQKLDDLADIRRRQFARLSVLPCLPIIKHCIHIRRNILRTPVIHNLRYNLLRIRIKRNIRKYHATCHQQILHMWIPVKMLLKHIPQTKHIAGHLRKRSLRLLPLGSVPVNKCPLTVSALHAASLDLQAGNAPLADHHKIDLAINLRTVSRKSQRMQNIRILQIHLLKDIVHFPLRITFYLLTHVWGNKCNHVVHSLVFHW